MCSKGLAPSPFIPFGCPTHSFPRVLKNESVGMGDEGGLWPHIPPPKACTQLPCVHDRTILQANTLPPQGFTWSSTLLYQDEEVPKAQCPIWELD